MVSIIVGSGHGEPAVPVDDRGLSYGDGLFETILVTGGRPQLLKAHCDRLMRGASRLGIPLEQSDLDRALAQAAELIDGVATGGRQVLKLVLTRGGGGRGYRPPETAEPCLIVTLSAAPLPPPARGVDVAISEVPLTVNPVLAGLKTLNRLEQVMASRTMPASCFESLMCGDHGDLREGTRTALLYRWQNRWWTPPRDRVAVRSVMLDHTEAALMARGEPLHEGLLFAEQCWQAGFGGLVLLNSVFGAVPVRSLAGRQLPHSEQLATIVGLAKLVEETR